MSDFTANIKCPKPVIEFMVTRYGDQPIRFPRKDRFNTMISFAVQKPPKDYHGEQNYGDETLRVYIPGMEDRNVTYWNFLSEIAQAEIAGKMKALMKAEFHSFIDKAKSKDIDFNLHASIYLFMEQNAISPEAFDMFLKERKRYLERIRKHRKHEKITSDKDTVCP